MVEAMPPGRLVLFPQLVLASVAALCTPYVHLFRLALELTSKACPCLCLVLACSMHSSHASENGANEPGAAVMHACGGVQVLARIDLADGAVQDVLLACAAPATAADARVCFLGLLFPVSFHC